MKDSNQPPPKPRPLTDAELELVNSNIDAASDEDEEIDSKRDRKEMASLEKKVAQLERKLKEQEEHLIMRADAVVPQPAPPRAPSLAPLPSLLSWIRAIKETGSW